MLVRIFSVPCRLVVTWTIIQNYCCFCSLKKAHTKFMVYKTTTALDSTGYDNDLINGALIVTIAVLYVHDFVGLATVWGSHQ